jgi:hypothetical protein
MNWRNLVLISDRRACEISTDFLSPECAIFRHHPWMRQNPKYKHYRHALQTVEGKCLNNVYKDCKEDCVPRINKLLLARDKQS